MLMPARGQAEQVSSGQEVVCGAGFSHPTQPPENSVQKPGVLPWETMRRSVRKRSGEGKPVTICPKSKASWIHWP